MTQSTDVFRHMSEEECQSLVGELREALRPLYAQIEGAAASTLRVRPVFLRKQPFPKRCEMIRKAMALRVNAEIGSEILATFFLDRYSQEVVELLESLKIEHEEGVLKSSNPAQPEKELLSSAVAKFKQGKGSVMRTLLLKAFASQSAIDWPELDEMVFPKEISGAK